MTDSGGETHDVFLEDVVQLVERPSPLAPRPGPPGELEGLEVSDLGGGGGCDSQSRVRGTLRGTPFEFIVRISGRDLETETLEGPDSREIMDDHYDEIISEIEASSRGPRQSFSLEAVARRLAGRS